MRIETQNSRNSDPLSSHLSGEQITKSGNRQSQINLVVEMVGREQGKTSAELAEINCVDRYMVARRLPDAIEVEKGAMRICSVSKRKAVTWWMV